jgi:hypothetical protein
MNNEDKHESHSEEDKKRRNNIGKVTLQEIVLYVAMQDPINAYYRSDALAHGFRSVLREYPILNSLFEGDEPVPLMRILDVRQETYLTQYGRNYVERHIRRDFRQAITELDELSDKIWAVAKQYLKKK